MKIFHFLTLFDVSHGSKGLLPPGLSCKPDTARELDEDRIINGVESEKGTWPWLIRFGKKGRNRSHVCGGSYLGKGWVLSSAHCFRKDRNSPLEDHRKLTTFFGDFYWEPNEQDNEAFIMKPQNAFAHPVADLVLLKFDEKKVNHQIQLRGGASYVREACIPDTHIPQGSKFHCAIAGWGMMNPRNSFSVSNKLLEANINILDEKYCERHSGYKSGPGYFDGSKKPNAFEFDFPREFCAGNVDTNGNGKTDPGRDACGGDSGGPIICAVDGMPIIVGVTARGESCGLENFPGIYVATAEYTEWITETTNHEVGITPIGHYLSDMEEPKTTAEPETEEPQVDTEEPTTNVPSGTELRLGVTVFAVTGRNIFVDSLDAAIRDNLQAVFEHLYPKWKASKYAAQTKKFRKMATKIFTTCSKKATCVATATDDMIIPEHLNELGQMRFFITDVLDTVRQQWYSNADARTKAKGDKAMLSLVKLTNKLLDFAVRFYIERF